MKSQHKKQKLQRESKKVKHLTHINLKGITKGTPESDIHTFNTQYLLFIIN